MGPTVPRYGSGHYLPLPFQDVLAHDLALVAPYAQPHTIPGVSGTGAIEPGTDEPGAGDGGNQGSSGGSSSGGGSKSDDDDDDNSADSTPASASVDTGNALPDDLLATVVGLSCALVVVAGVGSFVGYKLGRKGGSDANPKSITVSRA